MSLIPAPALLGLPPDKFPEWRRNQDAAILFIKNSATKFTGVLAPTGFGKSAMVMGHALWTGERTCILTSTKALQDQYQEDFGDLLLDIRGQNNYDCEIAMVTAAEGPCHGGMKCELKADGCRPFDLKRLALEAPIVSTNYQFWMHTMRERVGLGHFDRVIMDESHNIGSELAKFLSTRISGREFSEHLSKPPDKDWISWAGVQSARVTGRMIDLRTSKMPPTQRYKQASALKDLKRRLSLLAHAHADGWIMSSDDYRGFTWDCIHPGRYASKLLFQRADKFLLTSASIRPKTFSGLYITPTKVTFKEYPSTFPVARRPIYYYGAIAYSFESTEHEINYLVAVMDQWISRRLDRKGIIHSVSYERAIMFKSLSKHGHLMMTHGKDELTPVVKEFKAAKHPRILVSPAIVEGHSFPYREAEWAMVPKIPFADTKTDIFKARAKTDRSHGMLETCVAIRQMLGRSMRAEDDQSEGIILDKQFEWLYRSYKRLFPQDFIESVKMVATLPAPPPSLVLKNIPK